MRLGILLLPLLSFLLWCALGYYGVEVLVENAIYLIKILSFFTFIIVFKKLKLSQFMRIEIIIKVTLIVYMLSVVLGGAFGIEAFESYNNVGRFGYKGVIIAQNEASGLVLASLLICGYNFSRGCADGYDKALFILATLGSLMLGTKAAAVLPFLVLSIIIVSRKGYIKALPYVLGSMVLFFVVLFLAVKYIPAVNSAVSDSLAYFIYQYEFYAKGNIVTLILSGRDNKFEFAVSNYIFENPLYLILGGYPAGLYSVEVDFIDLAFIFGGPLFSVYLFYFHKEFFNKKSRASGVFYSLSFVLILLVSNTAGHILISALALPYIAFLCVKDYFCELESATLKMRAKNV